MRKLKRASYSPASLVTEGIRIPVALAESLLSFSCDDPTRPQLRSVAFYPDPEGRQWLCATDGHTLMRAPISGSLPAGEARARCYWTRGHVAMSVKLAKVQGQDLILAWDAVEATGTACYPEVSQVVPSPGVSAAAVCALNPAYLVRAAKVGEVLNRGGAGCTVVVRSLVGRLDPVRFDLVADEDTTIAEIVVMPMRAAEKVSNGATEDTTEAARAAAARSYQEAEELRQALRDARADVVDARRNLSHAIAEQVAAIAEQVALSAELASARAELAAAKEAKDVEGTTITTIPDGDDHVVLVSRARVPRRVLSQWGR